MTIKAVVLDIGGVLEVIDDGVFPGPAERRLGLPAGSIAGGLSGLPGDAVLGAVTEDEIRAEWRRALDLDEGQVDELIEDYWRWYVGTLDRPLLDWFAAQHVVRRTGILSNSGPGARERERHHGFEDVTHDIVYSHEVGLAKPDPAAYALVTDRHGVEPHEVLFLDDVEVNVQAARRVGWHAVLHVDTATSIREMEDILEREQGRRTPPERPGRR